MALSAAHLQAIRAAQESADWKAGQTGKIFSEKFQANYKEIVERREAEYQATQDNKAETLVQMDNLINEQSSLGFWKGAVTDWLGGDIETAMYAADVKNPNNKFEREKEQLDIINGTKPVLNELATSIQTLNIFSKANLDGGVDSRLGFSEAHKTEKMKDTPGFENYTKYDVFTALGKGWKAGELNVNEPNKSTIIFEMDGEEEPKTLTLEQLKGNDFKVDLKNKELLEEEDKMVKDFVISAKQKMGDGGNMNEKDVTEMVRTYLLEKSDEEIKYLAFNRWGFNEKLQQGEGKVTDMLAEEDDTINPYEEHVVSQMVNAITSRYKHIGPKVEEVEEEKIDKFGPAKEFIANLSFDIGETRQTKQWDYETGEEKKPGPYSSVGEMFGDGEFRNQASLAGLIIQPETEEDDYGNEVPTGVFFVVHQNSPGNVRAIEVKSIEPLVSVKTKIAQLLLK